MHLLLGRWCKWLRGGIYLRRGFFNLRGLVTNAYQCCEYARAKHTRTTSEAGYYFSWEDSAPTCTSCELGFECPSGTNLSNIIVESGYFRFTKESDQVYFCSNGNCQCDESDGDESEDDDYCSERRQAGQNLCKVGSGGPLCTVCSDGYFKTENDLGVMHCETCTEWGGSSAFWIAIPLIGVICLTLFSCFAVRKMHEAQDRRKSRRELKVPIELDTGPQKVLQPLTP